MNDFTFSDAELPWLPVLCDVEYFKVNSDDPTYWQKFGWEALEVPSDAAIVSNRMSQLKIRFDERYANRMLNSETMERWQIRLQNRFDEVVKRYNRMYELYQIYDSDMKEDILSGDKTVTTSDESGSMTATSKGTDTSKGTGRNIDTPDEKINDVTGYAGSRTESTGKSESSVTNNTNSANRRDSTVTRTITGQGVVNSVNDSVMAWRDIDTEFVKEFENCFLNIFWC